MTTDEMKQNLIKHRVHVMTAHLVSIAMNKGDVEGSFEILISVMMQEYPEIIKEQLLAFERDLSTLS